MDILLRFITVFFILCSSTLTSQRLEEGFENPPNEARTRALWVLVNGNFSLSRMTEELKEFKDKGMGGVDIWDVRGWVDENQVVPAGPKFMGEESLQAIAHGIREGKKLDMLMGLTISSSWNAGGDWVDAKDGVMGLFSATVKIKGGRKTKVKLPFPKFPKKNKRGVPLLIDLDENGRPSNLQEVAVVAYKPHLQDSTRISNGQVLDLTEKFDGKKLVWNAPQGDWVIERFVALGTGQPLMNPSPKSNGLMIDHFSQDAMKHNLNFFFDKLESKLGNLADSGLDYLYTDSYEANSATWTKDMPAIFKKRNGYDMVPFLPVLQGKQLDDETITERFLFDFKQTLSDLIIDNHYALGKAMCAEQGIGFIAEAGGPGPPLHNTPFESLRALGSLSAPRGEFWFDTLRDSARTEHTQIVKGPASAAHLYNRPRVEAEAFTGTQLWQFGPGDLKPTADRAMAEGLNSFIYHTTPHIPPEAGEPGWVYNFGTLINTTRIWWPKSKSFHEYLGRSCFLLQQGNFVGDVLFYYGDEAPNFIDHNANLKALGFGYDYDGLNTDILLNKLQVKDGYFVLPHGPKYKVLVLPENEAINPKVLQKIEALVRQGGTVIGNPPKRAHGLYKAKENDHLVKQLAEKLWGTTSPKKNSKGQVYTTGHTIPSVLRENGVGPDLSVTLDNPSTKLRYIHRTGENFDSYFLQNTTNEPLIFEATFRSAKGSPELWCPDSGTRTPQWIFEQQNGQTKMPMAMQPGGSVFVIFQKGKLHQAFTKVLKDGETCFPNKNNRTPIVPKGSAVVLAEPGKYTLIDDSGKKREKAVVSPEEIPLTNDWELRFPFGWGAPQSMELKDLKSWAVFEDPFIKHFSGTVSYHQQFNWSEELSEEVQYTLNLGDVSKVAEVFLNGKRIRTLWHAPYTVDISEYLQVGENYLVVEVANVMVNRLIGDAKGIYGQVRTHSNITKTPNAWKTPYKEAEPLPSGLIGPVKIVKRDKLRW